MQASPRGCHSELGVLIRNDWTVPLSSLYLLFWERNVQLWGMHLCVPNNTSFRGLTWKQVPQQLLREGKRSLCLCPEYFSPPLLPDYKKWKDSLFLVLTWQHEDVAVLTASVRRAGCIFTIMSVHVTWWTMRALFKPSRDFSVLRAEAASVRLGSCSVVLACFGSCLLWVLYALGPAC